MPQQDTYDRAEMQRRLEAWLSSRIEGASNVEVTDLRAPGETGHSSETMLFDANWTDEGGSRSSSLVLRTRPTGHVVFPIYDLALQYDVMERIGAAAPDLPMPPLRWMEPSTEPLGREFFVMERVDGLVPPDNLPYTMNGWLLDSTPEQQRRLQTSSIDVLADIHAIDWRSAGLGILDEPRYGATGLDQQLGFYDYFLEWGRLGRPQPTLDRMAAWLSDHRPVDEPQPVLNWGDARIGNILYRDHRPVAILDWEMATLGPREVDLAWMLLFQRFFSTHLGVAELPGFGSMHEMVDRYQERAGYRVRDFEWYLLWAAHRYGVVMMRLVQAAELSGADLGFTEEDNVAITMLEALEKELT
jgi:aminoglycoside phosphotransferase (APT) family kinase protein